MRFDRPGDTFPPEGGRASPDAYASASMEVLPCRWARFGFTRREIDVAGLLILGLTNKEIGRTLTIAVGTVNVHVAEILRKTVAGTRTQAAYRLGSGI